MKKSKNNSRRNFIKDSAITGAAFALPGFLSSEVLNEISDIRRVAGNFSSGITIDSNFENGHITDYTITESGTILMGPISFHKDTWFSFRIRGVKHRTITFIFEWINNRKVPANFNGAVNNTGMISYDGNGWEIISDVKFRLKDPAVNPGNYFQTLVHTFREDEAMVTYCAPWSNKRMEDLAVKLKSNPFVTIDKIGMSKFRNLPLTYFKITDKTVPDKYKKKFFLVAREDSYEAGGSWAAEGIIRYLLSDDPVVKEMLKKMAFIIFPIFSVDGVAIGSTNYPLDPENSQFVYVTAYWDREEPYHEVKLMKDYWEKLKQENFIPDVCFKLHSTCYWECHFRPEDCAKENLGKERELLDLLRKKLSWRIEAGPHSNPKAYMNYNFIKVFPDAITYSSHNDFIFTSRYLGTDKPVYRRHEDVMQDGELIARCFAEFYGIPHQDVAPFLMAGNVDKNCGKKGSEVTYYVYYYDVNELPPVKINVVINNKAYQMTCDSGADYKKPVKYSFITALDEPINNYRFIASNGKKERKIPDEDYSLPGPFILK